MHNRFIGALRLGFYVASWSSERIKTGQSCITIVYSSPNFDISFLSSASLLLNTIPSHCSKESSISVAIAGWQAWEQRLGRRTDAIQGD